MATHDYNIDNQTAPSFRSDLNSALQAIVTQNSNATAPSVTFANMIWYDVTNKQIKKRNEANTNWITLGTVDEALSTFLPNSLASQAEAETGTANDKLMTPLRVAQAAAIFGGGFTTLGTLVTTSGSTHTLSGLNLTGYKFLYFDLNGISVPSGPGQSFAIGSKTIGSNLNSSDINYGFFQVSLLTGRGFGLLTATESATASSFAWQNVGYSTATTSVSVSINGGSFDAGSVTVYGIK